MRAGQSCGLCVGLTLRLGGRERRGWGDFWQLRWQYFGDWEFITEKLFETAAFDWHQLSVAVHLFRALWITKPLRACRVGNEIWRQCAGGGEIFLSVWLLIRRQRVGWQIVLELTSCWYQSSSMEWDSSNNGSLLWPHTSTFHWQAHCLQIYTTVASAFMSTWRYELAVVGDETEENVLF